VSVAFDVPEGSPARYDLCPSEGYRAWAKAMGEGVKYGPYNWMKGMPYTELINRIEAHVQAFKAGDTSEEHVGHIMANCGMLAYFAEHRPEFDDRRPVSKSLPVAAGGSNSTHPLDCPKCGTPGAKNHDPALCAVVRHMAVPDPLEPDEEADGRTPAEWGCTGV
jgi:hypothetical protein